MYYPITTSKALIRPAIYNVNNFLEPLLCARHILTFLIFTFL